MASLLDLPYEDLPELCGKDADSYHANLDLFLQKHRLVIVSVPIVTDGGQAALGGVMFPGKTKCLLAVDSKRFDGKQHHIVGEVSCFEHNGVWHWKTDVLHDPYKREDPYTLRSIEYVFQRIE